MLLVPEEMNIEHSTVSGYRVRADPRECVVSDMTNPKCCRQCQSDLFYYEDGVFAMESPQM